MKEEDFRREILKSAKHFDWHIIDLADELKKALSVVTPDVRARLSGLIQEKPYDLGFLADGSYLALELKLIKEGFTFPFNKVETHQLIGLVEVEKHKGLGYVVVLFRKTLTSTQKKKYKVDHQVLNEAFAIPVEAMDLYLTAGLTSISLEDLRKLPFKLKQKDGIWNINKLLND